MSRVSALLAAVFCLVCLAVLCAQTTDLPSGPLQVKVKTACLECHDSSIIEQQRLSKAAWTKEVDKMMKWGAVIDPADREAFVEYLCTNFSADKEPYVAPRTMGTKKKQGR